MEINVSIYVHQCIQNGVKNKTCKSTFTHCLPLHTIIHIVVFHNILTGEINLICHSCVDLKALMSSHNMIEITESKCRRCRVTKSLDVTPEASSRGKGAYASRRLFLLTSPYPSCQKEKKQKNNQTFAATFFFLFCPLLIR